MFRTYAKVKYEPYTKKDRENIVDAVHQVFQSHGLITQRGLIGGLIDGEREPDISFNISISIPYNENIDVRGFEYPDIFLAASDRGLSKIIADIKNIPLLKNFNSNVINMYEKNPRGAVRYDQSATGSSKPIIAYSVLLKIESKKPFIAPEPSVSDALPSSSNGFLIPLPKRERGGRSPELLQRIQENEDFRRAIGITPELESIIASTRLEYGTCQICDRIMKMFVSGENTNRFTNLKGTIFDHNSIDIPGKRCPGTSRLPYELSRDTLRKYITEYKAGSIVKPVNPVRLAELESRYASWRFKDPTKTPWTVTKAKPSQRTLKAPVIEAPVVKAPPVVKTPVVKTPAVKTPAVKAPAVKAPPVVKAPVVKAPVVKAPAVKLTRFESLFKQQIEDFNSVMNYSSLSLKDIKELIPTLKIYSDKMPGSIQPVTTGVKFWIDKFIEVCKDLDAVYNLGDLTSEELKEVISSMKPILDKISLKGFF